MYYHRTYECKRVVFFDQYQVQWLTFLELFEVQTKHDRMRHSKFYIRWYLSFRKMLTIFDCHSLLFVTDRVCFTSPYGNSACQFNAVDQEFLSNKPSYRPFTIICNTTVGNENCNQLCSQMLECMSKRKVSSEAKIKSASYDTFILTAHARAREKSRLHFFLSTEPGIDEERAVPYCLEFFLYEPNLTISVLLHRTNKCQTRWANFNLSSTKRDSTHNVVIVNQSSAIHLLTD